MVKFHCLKTNMVLSHLRHLELPHIDKKRWQKLKELYAELDGVQDGKDLTVVLEKLYNVAGNNSKLVSPDRSVEILNSDGVGSSWCFEGLRIFLEEIATREEKEAFFVSVLPFVVSLASSVDEFAPSESILLCSQQRGEYCLHISIYWLVHMIVSFCLN